MGRWSRKLRKFTVRVNYLKHGTARITLPKPIVDLFEKPEDVVFEYENGRILVYPK